MLDLAGNPKHRFSRDAAQLVFEAYQAGLSVTGSSTPKDNWIFSG